MGIFKEFKEFAVRGNMIDMAVGIIMGGAFGGVVNSLVKDVIMPPIGKAMSGVDFSSLAYVLQSADPANNKEAITISYGVFINAVINFLVVAFAVFMLVKGINTARKRLEGEQEAATPPEPSDEVKLLTQIRDSLAHRA